MLLPTVDLRAGGGASKEFRNIYDSAMEHFNCFSEKPIVLGNLDEYDEREFNSNDEDFKIFIHNKQIIITSFNSEVHESTAGIIATAVTDSINECAGLSGSSRFYPTGSPGIKVVNLLGCKSRFKKLPDQSIDILPPMNINRIHPSIVIEVAVVKDSVLSIE